MMLCSFMPLNYEEMDDDGDIVTYYTVTFTADFGPWVKGQCVHAITVDIFSGSVWDFDPKGQSTHKVEIEYKIKAQVKV